MVLANQDRQLAAEQSIAHGRARILAALATGGSSTTRTGRTRAQKLFPDLKVFHYPLDFPWSVWLTLRQSSQTGLIA